MELGKWIVTAAPRCRARGEAGKVILVGLIAENRRQEVGDYGCRTGTSGGMGGSLW